MAVPIPNISSNSTADSGGFGDNFFGAVNQSTGGGDFDWVGKVAIPLGVSVVAGIVLLMVSKAGKK